VEGPPFIDYSEIAWVLWDIPESRCLTTASHNRVSFIKPLSHPISTRIGRGQWTQLVCWRLYQRFGSQTFCRSKTAEGDSVFP